MFRLLISLFFVLLFFTGIKPVSGAGACIATRPENPALDLLIKTSQARGGAAANVPASILKAIYLIEAATAYSNPDQYNCPANPYGALGLMQIKEGEYKLITPDDEQMKDVGSCQTTNCKLSRCNASDAMELAARLLLYKINLWDANINKPTGKITTKNDVYYAAGRYYGSFSEDIGLASLVGTNQQPTDGTITYAEFVCAYSGFCKTSSDYPARTDQPYSGTKGVVKFTFNACTTPQQRVSSTVFDFHPLRPNPDDPISADAPLTTYCAMRPTPVETNRFDKREEFIDIKTVGVLTQDFRNFITPLLSITDPKKADYSLPFNDKAQRYMADFLEGRAYYEPFVEPTSPTPTQTQDLFNRLGVFRKLAPKTYQDELKRAIIQRAGGSFSAADNPYGFEPASAEINNYTVGSWQGQTVTLKDYVGNWAPLPSTWQTDDTTALSYEQAYANWKNSDGGKWSALWPYVPMFTREDTTGIIEIVDSNPPPDPYSPSGQYIEINKSNTTKTEVSHPHLARTYEVATSLSYLLTPQAVHEGATPPELGEEWIPKLWEGTIWWLDPSYKKPSLDLTPPLEFGPLCDVDPGYINLISSSGDTASDDIITTSVNRQDIQVINPEYQGPRSVQTNCGLIYPCEECVEDTRKDKITGQPITTYTINESACYYYKQVRSNPNYLITYTPFLNEILTSLSGSQRAIFDLFKPAGQEKQPYEEFDWPGVGNAGEESPVYDFSAGKAEAGARKPGDSQSYYYRYLGSLQCAKERVMMTLQPFISGSPYTPYATNCFKQLGEPGPGAQGMPVAGGCTDQKEPLSFANTASSPIARRAWEIVSDLYQGFWCYWNRSPGDLATDVIDYSPSYPDLFDENLYGQIPNPTSAQINQQYFNMFWCTWLVTKAFNETGHSMPTDLLFTPDMVSWFKGRNKYIEAGGASYKDIAPGDAVFFQIPPNYGRINHAAIVYSVTQDGFTTVESNAGYKTMFYPTDINGDIQVIVGDIKIEGFGKP